MKIEISISESSCGCRATVNDWHGKSLTEKMVEVLGGQEISSRSWWINRQEKYPSRVEKVLDSIHIELSQGTIIKNRGAYAEAAWRNAT